VDGDGDWKEVQPMAVLITSAGVYLILALVFLVIIGGGAYVGYRMSQRSSGRS
jgi:hypothetical protein